MQLKKSLTIITRIILAGFALAYPFIVFFALKRDIAIRFIGLVLLAVVIMSFVRHKNRILFLIGLCLCAIVILSNQSIFLKLYPVLMNCSVCAIFALSLKKTPLITQFAKMMKFDLNDNELKYTRNATIAWAYFMGINTVLSLITVFLSNEIWVLYNGFISYILIGLMMMSEYIVRKRVSNVQLHK